MDPFVVPARGEVELECEATTYEPGPFSCPMYLFYHDSDYFDVKLTITGTAVAPRVADHAPKTP